MSGFAEYGRHDGLGLAELVRKGEVTPLELLEEAEARVEALDPKLGAVVYRLGAFAREAIQRGLPEGPFRGVPFLLKDLHTHLAGQPLSQGSRLFADFVPDHDTEHVRRFREAGLVIFGRSASPEFGLTTSTESALHGDTRNPWSRAHTAGGSSGGAAAAVAAGILPVANASDGGGSIRIPASCCGVFGLKPTRARNPAGPDVGEGWGGMSTQHVVSRSVRDCAALLDATCGPDTGAPYFAPPPARPFSREVGAPPGRLRIAVQTETWNGAPTHPDCMSAALEVADLLRELGHDVEESRLEVDREALGQATGVVIGSNVRLVALERAAALGRELREDDLEPITRGMVENARAHSATDYVRGIRTIHAAGRRVGAFLESRDLLLTPTLATPPLELGRLSLSRSDLGGYVADLMQTVGFTSLFNVSGNPAASLPLVWNAAGLPIGSQLVGRYGDEATLYRVASQLEEARPWFDRRPPVD